MQRLSKRIQAQRLHVELHVWMTTEDNDHIN
jgi:hypothetical protein